MYQGVRENTSLANTTSSVSNTIISNSGKNVNLKLKNQVQEESVRLSPVIVNFLLRLVL